MPKDRLPPLNFFRAFEAVGRHLSIKRASEELHLTRSAVSRQIIKLERHLGRPLFLRAHKKIRLTALGEQLLKSVSSSFVSIEQVLRRPARVPPSPRLIISVDPDFSALWLVPRIHDFYTIAPDTFIEVRAEENTVAPKDHKVSCMIQYAKVSDDMQTGDRLFRSRLFPVCSRNLPGFASLKVVNDLRRQVLLHDRSTAEWEEYLRLARADFEVDTKGHAVFTATANCLDAAARAHGVAMGDDFLAANYLADGILVRLFHASLLSANAYHFVAMDDPPNAASVAAFRTWLLTTIARERKRVSSRK